MNKLFVFGCSFSTGFGGHDYNIEVDKTWPKLLADKLNLELDNSAHAGQCNWVSILHFIDKRDEMQKGDVVIFEFTFFDRFNIYPTRAQLIDLEAFFINHKQGLNDVMKEYKDISFNWFKKQILKWCVDNDIKLCVWSAEGQIHQQFYQYSDIINFMPAPNSTNDKPNYSFYDKWQNEAYEQHIVKKDGEIDRHFNELGHERMTNHIYSIINENEYNVVYKKII
jgi:hypothetical protein